MCTEDSCVDFLSDSDNYGFNTVCTAHPSLTDVFYTVTNYCTEIASDSVDDPNYELF